MSNHTIETTNDAAENDDAGCWVAAATSRGALAPPPSPVSRGIKAQAAAAPSYMEQSEASDRSSDNNVRASSDASRFLRATLADALSSSLATIAGVAAEHDPQQQNAEGGSSSSSSSSDVQRQSSSSSGSRYGPMNAPRGPAVVTASGINTSSGGDTSGGGTTSNATTSSNAPMSYAHAETMQDTGPFLRHYQRRRQQQQQQPLAARDGHGLPVPLDERLDLCRRDSNNNSHTAVLARLPPPQTETSSSFFSSSSDKGGSGGSGGEEQRHGHPLPARLRHYGRGDAEVGRQQQPSESVPVPPTNSTSESTCSRPAARHGKKNVSETKNPTSSSKSQSLRDSDSSKHTTAAAIPPLSTLRRIGIKRQRSMGDSSCCSSDSGDSSSGTDGGYAGSASSNDNGAQGSSSCSSPSVSSSEGSYPAHRSRGSLGRKQRGLSLSSSLEAASYRSRVSSAGDYTGEGGGFGFNLASRSCSPVSSTFSNSSNGSSDELEDDIPSNPPPTSRKKDQRSGDERRATKQRGRDKVAGRRRRRNELGSLQEFHSKMERATGRTLQPQSAAKNKAHPEKVRAPPLVRKTHASLKSTGLIDGQPPIFTLGCDTMAHCLSYLEPPEVHQLLTMPLSRDWHTTFTQPHDLWRILCLSPPFKAKFDNDDNDSSDESLCSFPTTNNNSDDVEIKHLFGRYRLLYTSFIRCMRYLARIQDDAVHGRPPSLIDYGGAGLSHHPFTSNSKLKNFLARARGVVDKKKRQREEESVSLSSSSGTSSPENVPAEGAAPMGVSDSDTSSAQKRQRQVATQQRSPRPKPNPNVKYGHSVLTQRLLGPAKTGEVGNVNLPWSCAIYSIVNWMVAFSDVEGIQTLCLKVLPCLLEDENQRTTAQRAGLTSIVLRGMVLFPDSFELHTAAFHTIVLLARPLGGREGMLFHSSMVNSSGVFSNGSHSGKNGIAVMLDSMRRFASEEALQAMSCWSLVNIALATSQKSVLVKLGGISAVASAMMQHPYSAEVQFRALFALINLVIPSVTLSEETSETRSASEQLGEVNDITEKEILDENVGQIANLVVLAMKNFCSSQTILNRACLVLHNLSLTNEYHTTLLWTPNCYQMLEWCLANYPSDQVLQQSAAGTLHRLQLTLSSDDSLRRQFTASIQAQQQLSLEQAHREATLLRDQQEQGQNNNA